MRWRAPFDQRDRPDDTVPAEIFSAERLELFAEELARSQEVSAPRSAGVSLHSRLRAQAAELSAAFRSLDAGIEKGEAITPAAAWLVDNYYIVDEHIKAIRRDLPPGFYKELPKLSNGRWRGYPRVYGIAVGLIDHTDNLFDLDTLSRYCRAYQRIQPLTIGELWAVAITLRVLLIEHLSRLASGIVRRRALREQANELAEKVLAGDGRKPAFPSVVLPPESFRLAPAYAAQLFQRLRDHDPDATPALAWLEQRLGAQNTTPDEVVHTEHQRQGAVNLSVRNIITSLRLISSVDWAKFFEGVSLVDELLRRESSFASYDFATRDLYRHAIEELSRRSNRTELEVARQALDAASAVEGKAGAPGDDHAREPGYYLVSQGRAALERRLGYRATLRQSMARATCAAGVGGYAGGAAVLSLAAAVPLLVGLGHLHVSPAWMLIMLGLGIIAASDIAIALINIWIARLCAARILPGLELKEGVPQELRTVVVIPALLTTVADVAELVLRLEVHFLSSQDGEVHFALLSDWRDADSERVPGDDALLAAAAEGLARLNRIYGALPAGDRFLLLHRRRQWNEAQGRWMGWERKRGKLHEFNQLLRGSAGTSFMGTAASFARVPKGVRYVISLDSDTRLPRGAAVGLIGKMAHPLNAPRFDAERGRVTEGYGILQPRVTPSLPDDHEASIFQNIFSGPSGIDPYAFAVSDAYQDMFGEGSYSGKGIYDVDAFESALADRVPENRLLSHDLFEGIYARSGLASDVEVIEEYPSKYAVASARQHRWTRGDWQLLPWVLGRGQSLNALGRWKMFDNLRRSLVAPAVLVGLTLSWVGPATAYAIALFLGGIVLPILLPYAVGLSPQGTDLTPRVYIRKAARDTAQAVLLAALRLLFLADLTWVMADAIVRTLYRVVVSRKRLLEWTTTAQSKLGASLSRRTYYRAMSGGVLLALLAALVLVLSGRGSNPLAITLLVAWCFAPTIARTISLPSRRPRNKTLTVAEVRRLRLQARQTFGFFQVFVTDAQNMLPPDNFQEIPHPVIANRTSPTNIGLYLLSVIAAREFGWTGAHEAIERLEATFATLDKLETFRGHFYNWYDTHDLRPLDPKYISTVDSGNLAGHLLTLAGALRSGSLTPAAPSSIREGLLDTMEALRGVVEAVSQDQRRNYGVSPRQLGSALDSLAATLQSEPVSAFDIFVASTLERVDAIRDIAEALNEERGDGTGSALLEWCRLLRANVQSHQRDLPLSADQPAFAARVANLAQRAYTLAHAMEFGFLLQPERQLLSIGYRIADHAQDPSCYDLLASEARLASFVAIAKGDLPVRHWFRLGRRLTPVGRSSALVSWSGSMFEYLMPVLVMREPDGSVLGETARMVVKRQIQYGSERRLPWGVSESALNARDREFTYQYSPFGVPALGLQRGLDAEAVVAPYATALAAMIDPQAALRNFERLQELGARGQYGWYDALDFTPARLPKGLSVVPVRAYMAHHQGMVLLSIADVLKDGIFRTFFHSISMIQATELLLQEKTPQDEALSRSITHGDRSTPEVRELKPAPPRRYTSPHQANPRTQLLSNGNYSVMLTAAGSGFSRWRNIAVTRWQEDVTRDQWGSYIFLRDVADGSIWSAGYQPVGREPESYAVEFYEDRAEITRRDGSILTSTEILVSPEEDAEVRRVSLTNESNRPREIELTTYAEVVLATSDADLAHAAFSKLFIRTEFLAESGALLATRRGREPGEPQLWMSLVSALEGEGVGGLQFETDRARFLGRGHELRDAVSVIDARPLSGTAGVVLDPVLSLRRRVRIGPGETARVAFWTSISASRAEALALIDKHRDMAAFDRVKTLAWTHAQVQLRYLGVDFDAAQKFQRIANRVLYADPSLRATREVLEKNQLGQAALWPHGISGDLPIVLVRVEDENESDIVRELLRAHEYWRLKRLAVDLVILNDRATSYVSELQTLLDTAIRTAQVRRDEDGSRRGGVFLLRGEHLTADVHSFLQSVARVVFVGRRGTLSDQLARAREPEPKPRRRRPVPRFPIRPDFTEAPPTLEFFNGIGGFSAAEREYVVVLDEDQWTPAPWSNVIANAQFGFLATADGAGCTWSINSQQNRLTPWSNDPIANTPAEAIYLRDDENADLWSATPLPIREPNHTYVIRHGFGYSRYEHRSHGFALDLLQFVPLNDSVKISRLKIRNLSERPRQLSVTHYLDWVLGTQRSKTSAFLVTERDPETGAMFARNPWSTDYSSRIAYLDMGGRQQSMTGDRAEFIGRHGSLAEPAALLIAAPLSNRVGGGLDPCGALQTKLSVPAGEEIEFTFLLGDAPTRAAAVALIQRYRALDLDAVLKEVTDFWVHVLDAVQVKTPDRSMDMLLNGWLLYQTLACRVWGRTAFYQSSGAYGFRDQLQDVMALCISQPAIAREHILRAAGRQFEAGDTQHWWLPTSGMGVKTRVSDDRVWLPFVLAHYLEVTGDSGVLDESIDFLAGGPLPPEAHEVVSAPGPGAAADLFEHCSLALNSSLTIGSHGLPLFGTGDWNDGMNRVGEAGRGESVWLAWFLHTTLMQFAPVAERRGRNELAGDWRRHAFALQKAIEREAWDGDWYRRGYFDDGTPLGSVSSDECRIDSIAQSWAVISGAGEPARAQRAMAAVNAQLVSRSDGLVQLFTPPFERTAKDPGYIKAYPPGIRENGGQYTHAATWSVMAFALMGDGDRAAELFSLINPINHASTLTGIHRYKVEPYVACADIYSAPAHIGRGGWTWYTGSAAWIYRTALESILGVHIRGDRLTVDPCIPRSWRSFEVSYRFHSARYRITVENPSGVTRGVARAVLDGATIAHAPPDIPLIDDGRDHVAIITLG